MKKMNDWQKLALAAVAATCFIVGAVNGRTGSALYLPIIGTLVAWAVFSFGNLIFNKLRTKYPLYTENNNGLVAINSKLLNFIAVTWLAIGSVLWLIGGLKFSSAKTSECAAYNTNSAAFENAYDGWINSDGPGPGDKSFDQTYCLKYKNKTLWYPTSNAAIKNRLKWSNDTRPFLVVFVLSSVVLVFWGLQINRRTIKTMK